MFNLMLYLICQYRTFLTYATLSYKKIQKKISDDMNGHQTFATYE